MHHSIKTLKDIIKWYVNGNWMAWTFPPYPRHLEGDKYFVLAHLAGCPFGGLHPEKSAEQGLERLG